MAMRIKMKRYTARIIAPGADSVVAWYPVPKDGVWLGGTLNMHAVMGAALVASDKATMWAISGYFIPVNDLTALPASPDAFWDTQIVKDATIAEDALDLDHTTDANPAISQGQPDLALMTDAHTGPIRLFRTERLISFASGGRTMVTTAGAETYIGIDRVNLRTRKQVRAKSRPGVVLMAVSKSNHPIPEVFTGTVESAWAPGQSEDGATVAEFEWRILKYMQKYMEDAAVFLMPGGVEAGAQEPYEKAAELAGRTVEQAFEETALDFDISASLQTWTIGTGSIVVPGRPNMKVLKGN